MLSFFSRLFFLSILTTPFLITLSCSSLTKKDTLDSKQESLLLAYQKAKTKQTSSPQESCDLFRQISKEEFPLSTLAKIKSHLVCTPLQIGLQDLPQMTEELLQQEPWLLSLDLERQIQRAETENSAEHKARLLLKKSQLSDRVKDKVQILQSALALTNVPADLQQELSGRLQKLAPRFMSTPSPADYFKVANDLIFQREFAKGREYLSRIINGAPFSNEDQYLARRALRNSYKLEQQKENYQKSAKEFSIWCETNCPPQRGMEATITWSRAAWTMGHLKEAHQALNRAEKKWKKRIPLDEVYYLRGKMAEEEKDFSKALLALESAKAESKPQTLLREKILFSQAWIHRRLQNETQAAAELEQLSLETQDPFDKNRYLFWLAKTLKTIDQNRSENILKNLTELDPLGYYGLLSHRELGQELPPLRLIQDSASDRRPSDIESRDFLMTRSLLMVDESDILEKFLNDRTLSLKNEESRSQRLLASENKNLQEQSEKWLFYLKAYARAGLFNPLFQQLGTLTPDIKNHLLLSHPELLFPRKFESLIQSHSEKFGVKQELVYSIIRQESAFNPLARSPADALGLMQVIPSVAQAQEKYTGLKVDHFENLYQPEINIPVGISLLAQLGKKYRGQFVLTAAAYNANEKAIENWLKTRLDEDPLEFIENIPYEETRGYVKLVLRNFVFYSRLAQPGRSVAFPNWCLEDLHSFKVSTR